MKGFMRIDWVDVAKGIGIILVTVGHTDLRHLFGDYVDWWINAFHMPLFFVMAGLCFDVDRYPNFGRYVLRKIRALGWPYFALATFMAFLSIGLYWGNNPRWSFWGQVRVFKDCETMIAPFWFIKTLFEVEIVFWPLAKVVQSPRRILMASMLIGGIGAFVVPEGVQTLRCNTVLVSVFYYALGYALKDAAQRFTTKRNAILLGVGLGVVAVYSILIAGCFHYRVGYGGCLLGNKLLFFPLSLLAIFGVSVLSMGFARIPYVRGTFVWLGVNSIVLMAIHEHFGIFKASWVEKGVGSFPAFVVEYALLAVLAWALAGPLNFLVRFPWKKG